MLPKKVLNRFLLVEFLDKELKTDSGIYLPSVELTDAHRKAKVIMVSSKVSDKISEGDIIMVDKAVTGEVYDKYEFITIDSVYTVI